MNRKIYSHAKIFFRVRNFFAFRRAFILTEILMSMMLQSLFAITLCAAFYMLLSFGSTAQQAISAHDDGDIVISYIDSRIRNAGLGLWRCAEYRTGNDVTGVGRAFNAATNFNKINEDYGRLDDNLNNSVMRATDILPVAIVSVRNDKAAISYDNGIYEGNVLNLLYANEDNKESETNNDKFYTVLQGYDAQSHDVKKTISMDNIAVFKFITFSEKPSPNFTIPKSHSNSSETNMKSWAVTEAGGVPIFLYQLTSSSSSYKVTIKAPYVSADIYPMTELLNLECVRIFVGKSTDEDSLKVSRLVGSSWSTLPYAKNVLEIHMILDTNKPIPIFRLAVLIKEGRNSGSEKTQCPDDWPSAYWKDDFSNYKLHIVRAEWRLHNLAPLFHPND